MINWSWNIDLGDVAATLGLVLTAISIWFAGRQIKLEHKSRTLEYTTNQFDRLAELGAREELRKMALQDKDIITYLENDDAKTQKLLEYVYTFNRLGAGIFSGSLREDVIFNIWTPKWFEAHWQRFQPLIEREKKRRGEEAKHAYVFFEWLAKIKCPKIRDKYPKAQLSIK